MRRRELLVLAPGLLAAQSGVVRPELIPAPESREQWARWREELERWREEMHAALRYDGSLYARTEFRWVTGSYSCCFAMLCDELFYDHRAGRYTLDRFLDHGREFGGFDSLVLWHAYPRIGLDDRNQFDFYREMPGGLAGLRELSRSGRARGVRVFLNYNPWDRATRREPVPDIQALVVLVREIDADGIFLDTMNRGAAEFRRALDQARPGVVLESEHALPLENVRDHHMSWAQWFRDSRAPGVLRNKWFERRHMLHGIDRWSRDHSGELHTAWMNGTGMLVWENVFGSWVGWNERDRAAYRGMLPVQRRHSRLFSGEGWTPLVEGVVPEGVYAGLWHGGGLRLWTLVNREERTVEGPLLNVQSAPGERYFDLIGGTEVRQLPLNGRLGPRGIGAFVAGTERALGPDFEQFLEGQRARRAAAGWSAAFPERHAALKPVVRTTGLSQAPAGMVAIPGGRVEMTVEFRIRECGFYDSTHPHFAGSGGHPLHRPIRFERTVELRPFALDLTPVTNGDFARFVKEAKYRPRERKNFLRHWRDGSPPARQEDHPVVWVDLEDARAYAAWADKRLPLEEEWQYAAQGPDGRRYPWGNEFDPARCNGGQTGGTTPVRAFPSGRSPFGCYDLCGNTWEWTESERSDGRTRFAIIRGGSWYRAQGSDWYMDGGPRPVDFAAKMLLMWPGLDRSATLGFRCAVDLA